MPPACAAYYLVQRKRDALRYGNASRRHYATVRPNYCLYSKIYVMRKEGTLKIKGSKITIKSDGKPYSVPKIFAVNESHVGLCEFIIENNQIINIFKDNQPIPLDTTKVEHKARAKMRKEEKEKFEKERDAAIQKEAQSTIKDIFKIKDTRLPKEVRNSRIWDVDNFYLKFHKYAAYQKFGNGKEKEFKLFFRDNEITHKIKFDFTQQKALIQQANKDQYQSAALLHGEDNVATTDLKIDWRLVVGLGGASVYETSITLHHLYGFPYIPASGVKGMVNAYVHTQITDYEEKDKNDIFGSEKEAGKIIFYDALPTEAPTIKPDVMNPHYTPYYQPKNTTEYPADYHKPVPVNFLTVTDTTFRFTIGVCKGKRIEEEERKDLLKKAYQWLKGALEEQGIGAKTTVGYGYMS